MKISILCPTNRVENIIRMTDSIKQTCSGKHRIELVLRVDRGHHFDWNRLGEFPYIGVVGEPTFPDFGIMWNEAYDKSTGEIVQMAGDDLIYETPNWDEYVVEAFQQKFPDHIGLVWCRDHDQNHKLATHGFVHQKWVEAVGYLTPPYGLTYGNDDWLYLIAKGINRLCYLPNVTIRHAWDRQSENTKRMWEFKKWSGMLVYSPWGEQLRQHAINRLQEKINAFGLNNSTDL